jgi:hypothetical protein
MLPQIVLRWFVSSSAASALSVVKLPTEQTALLRVSPRYETSPSASWK